MPISRAPIHLSYVLYLNSFSRALALSYWRTSLAMCRAFGVEPSLLLHPLDFLGNDDNTGLDFFPAMNLPAQEKMSVVSDVLAMLARSHRLVPMCEHARLLSSKSLPARSLAPLNATTGFVVPTRRTTAAREMETVS